MGYKTYTYLGTNEGLGIRLFINPLTYGGGLIGLPKLFQRLRSLKMFLCQKVEK
jgi:hypothetical protein